jgi:hypothetical protein
MTRAKAYKIAARLILKGRYGRACRTVARAGHAIPRLLSLAARKAWAEEQLAPKSSTAVRALAEKLRLRKETHG